MKQYREWLREHRGNGGEYVDAKTYSMMFNRELEPDSIIIQPRGFGDTIANITHATGLDKLSEIYTNITGKDCGCRSRQEYLNKLIPYGVK